MTPVPNFARTCNGLTVGDRVQTLGWNMTGIVGAIQPGRAWNGLDLLTVYTDASTIQYCTPNDVRRLGGTAAGELTRSSPAPSLEPLPASAATS